MDYNKLKMQWLEEENYAFTGWDFSHLDGRRKSEELPWDYREILKTYIKSTDKLLDTGTGGGEFLLSLNHPYKLTCATENYPPNFELCKKRLEPLGITVAQKYDNDKLPFVSDSFDIIINRHNSFNLCEVDRVLKQGGYFITQQVGCKNNNDLSKKIIANFETSHTSHRLENYLLTLKKLNYQILCHKEAFCESNFFDVGALVYYAKIIKWEFPNFSVDSCFDMLCKCQEEIERNGFIQGTEHRFLIVARKI